MLSIDSLFIFFSRVLIFVGYMLWLSRFLNNSREVKYYLVYIYDRWCFLQVSPCRYYDWLSLSRLCSYEFEGSVCMIWCQQWPVISIRGSRL